MKAITKLFSLLIGILILTNACSIFGIDPEDTPPSEVTNLIAEVIDNSVKLSWTNPTEDRFAKVVIRYSNTSDDSWGRLDVVDGSEEILITDLDYNTEYLFSVQTSSKTEWGSDGVEITVIIGPNESDK